MTSNNRLWCNSWAKEIDGTRRANCRPLETWPLQAQAQALPGVAERLQTIATHELNRKTALLGDSGGEPRYALHYHAVGGEYGAAIRIALPRGWRRIRSFPAVFSRAHHTESLAHVTHISNDTIEPIGRGDSWYLAGVKYVVDVLEEIVRHNLCVRK